MSITLLDFLAAALTTSERLGVSYSGATVAPPNSKDLPNSKVLELPGLS